MRLLDIAEINGKLSPILKDDLSRADVPVSLLNDKQISWSGLKKYVKDQLTSQPETSNKTKAGVERLIKNVLPKLKLNGTAKTIQHDNGYINFADLSNSYGNEYTDESIICEEQATSGFGKQICIVAKYWLEQKVREVTKNQGSYVDQFTKAYFGKVTPEPYCAVFVWYCNDEASKTLGIKNLFPGNSQAWGSTVKTLEAAKKLFKVDGIPAPGSCLFRKSNPPYNHMGIVIHIARGKFYSIEGNIKLKDDSEGIGLWEYDIADLTNPEYGFQFIHTELQAKEIVTAKEYLGYIPCRKTEEPKTDKPVKGKTEEPPKEDEPVKGQTKEPTEEENIIKKTAERIQKEFEEFEKLYKNDQTKIDEKKQELCETITFKIPPKENIPHYSVMKNFLVGDDMFQTTLSGKPISEIRGSALQYYSKNEDPGSHSHFGIFTDYAGNEIYVLRSNFPKGMTLVHEQYIGHLKQADSLYWQMMDSYNTFMFKDTGSDNMTKAVAEKYAARYFSWDAKNKNEVYKAVISARGESTWNDGLRESLPFFENPKAIYDGQYYPALRIQTFLKAVEDYSLKAGKRFDQPIVLCFWWQDDAAIKKAALMERLGIAFSMVSAVVGMNGVAGSISGKVIENILKYKDTFISLASGDYIKAASGIAEMLGGIAQLTMPESVKGFNEEYLGPAKKAVQNIVRGINSQNAAEYLGLNPKAVEDLYNQYLKGGVDNITKIVKDSGNSFNEVVKKVYNATNMLTVDQLNRWIGNDYLEDELRKWGSIVRTPVLQDLFAIGASDTVFPMVPGIQQLTSYMLGDNQLQNELQQLTQNKFNDVKAALIKSAAGYIPNPSLFDALTLESLVNKAGLSDLTELVLPPSIPKDKQICYKYEIEKRTSKTVIPTCEENYQYDATLRKCVQKGKIYVPEYPETEKPKLPDVPIDPVVPDAEVLPSCIKMANGKYYYILNGNAYDAKKNNGNWTAFYEGYWVLIENCKLQISLPELPDKPIVPVVPKIEVNSTCIISRDGKYYFSYEGKELQAKKYVDGVLWLAYYSGKWSPIVNCQLWYCLFDNGDGFTWKYQTNQLNASYQNGKFIVYSNGKWVNVNNCKLEPDVIPELPPVIPKIPVTEIPTTTKDYCDCVDKYHAQLVTILNEYNSKTKNCEDTGPYKSQIETLKNAVSQYEILVKNLSEKINNNTINYNNFKTEIDKYNTIINNLNKQLETCGTGDCNDYLVQIEKLKTTITEKEAKIRELEENKDSSIYQESHDYEASELKKEIDGYKSEIEEKNKKISELREKESKEITEKVYPDNDLPEGEIPKTKKTNGDCGCELDKPKMIVQRKIFQYPKDDCGEYFQSGNNEFL